MIRNERGWGKERKAGLIRHRQLTSPSNLLLILHADSLSLSLLSSFLAPLLTSLFLSFALFAERQRGGIFYFVLLLISSPSPFFFFPLSLTHTLPSLSRSVYHCPQREKKYISVCIFFLRSRIHPLTPELPFASHTLLSFSPAHLILLSTH